MKGYTFLEAVCVALGAIGAVASNTQYPFAYSNPSSPSQSYDEGLFTPLEDFSTLSASEYTSFGHPLFPNYNVRIKKSLFCDHSVDAYTGYIDIQARHLFFYFFKSRNDWQKDDVIFWTNGGPGCSSSLGLFMELGPCRINGTSNGTIHHPESWNEHANVFFIDQPIGVGFSYAEYGETVSTTEEAAVDIAAFVSIFFENFSAFKGRPFHMAGESYGGRYIPVFAAAVYDQNAALVKAGLEPINLKSIMIGNGMTDMTTMVPSYYDMQCTPASVDPILDVGSCVFMREALPRCQQMMKSACVDIFDAMSCGAAMQFCSGTIQAPFFSTGKNPYDISRDCEGEISETLCYPVTKAIGAYLDRPDVRKMLGVDPSITANFSSCNHNVGQAFALSMDRAHQTQHYIAELLERNVRVLIYVGEYDWICNWVGNERWTLALDWTGKKEFAQKELGTWKINGEVAGKLRSSGNLTFATIAGAGHMVPYDKPKESLEMVRRWLAEEAF